MQLFRCKCCAEKDKRIEDLKEQLMHQNSLVKAVIVPPSRSEDKVNQELQFALGGEGAPKNVEVLSEVEKQAIAMLTGSY